jgi:hypothetical protein
LALASDYYLDANSALTAADGSFVVTNRLTVCRGEGMGLGALKTLLGRSAQNLALRGYRVMYDKSGYERLVLAAADAGASPDTPRDARAVYVLPQVGLKPTDLHIAPSSEGTPGRPERLNYG